jgi:hypothetical protein
MPEAECHDLRNCGQRATYANRTPRQTGPSPEVCECGKRKLFRKENNALPGAIPRRAASSGKCNLKARERIGHCIAKRHHAGVIYGGHYRGV